MTQIPTAREEVILRQVFRQLIGRGTTNVNLRILRSGVLITGYKPDGSLQRNLIPFRHVAAVLSVHNPQQH